jgi:hypothetical protein
VEPTSVIIRMMDSRRPGVVAMIPAQHLRASQRLKRALRQMFIVGGSALLVSNLMLLFVPAPHLHLCSLPLAIVIGPIVGIVTWRSRVLLAESQIECPRCCDSLTVPAGLAGWPARFNCVHCAIMVEIHPPVL